MRPVTILVALALPFTLAVPLTSFAAVTVGAGLHDRLVSLAAGDSVSVILGLAGTTHPGLMTGTRRGARAMIRRLRDEAAASQAPVIAFLESRGYGGRLRSFWINNSIAVRVAVSLLPELEGMGALERIDYDEPVRMGEVERFESTQSVEWNLSLVGAPQVWANYGLDGTGIVVGSMDTGFDPNHPALLGKWRGGTNSWIDCVNSQPTPYDDHGHGTHTIGTMVGGDGPGPFSPDVGLAYNAKFISAKVLDYQNSFSSASTVVAGAQWMLDPDGNPATDDFPDVVNNSWLFFQQDYVGFHSAVAAWRAAGIVPVFCIGNNGPGSATTAPPGNYDNTIGVGATDAADQIASFSSRGPSPTGAGFPPDLRKPDLSAPGAAVLSCVPGGYYQYWYGTSMASPHVAGTVALMLQAHPGPMSLDEVQSALIATVVDRGTTGYDYDFGYGRLNSFAAVTEALNPGVHLTATSVGHEVRLAWTASTQPDLIRYDVYRGVVFDAVAPQLIGSTNDTSYSDPGRFGPFYYRVKAVRASGLSPFTNEVGLVVCSANAPDCYAVDALTTAPVSADFNGDDLLDVAFVNTLSAGTVKVAFGDGAGHFGSIATAPAGQRPIGIAVGDFNGDGIIDLAATNNVTAGTVSILIGNGSGGHGDGTFAAPVAYPVNQKPVGIVAGDFDQDGITDLAVACNAVGNVSILRGTGAGCVGDGGFAAPVSYGVGSRPNDIVTGDFNHDGALDLAVSNNRNSSLSILLGTRTNGRADGAFVPAVNYPCGASPYEIATGDFDADGILDLAVSLNASPGSVAVLRGQGSGGAGDGTFGGAVAYPAGSLPFGIAAADLNGDGITDLCVVNGSSPGTASVLLGTGSGGVGDGGFEAPAALSVGASPADVVIADFDRSGSPDIAVTNSTAMNNFCVLAASCPPEAGTSLAVLAPNGGESWPASTVQTIAWSKGPGVVSINIAVSRDGGVTWQTIATGQTGTSLPWMVTGPTSAAGAARVRVHDARVSAADASDAGFTVAPDIRLEAPPVPAAVAPALAVENPALDRLRVRFRLGGQAAATIEVLDVTGRRVAGCAVGGLGAGEHTLDLGRGLPSGLYVVRLSQGGTRITRKAVFVR